MIPKHIITSNSYKVYALKHVEIQPIQRKDVFTDVMKTTRLTDNQTTKYFIQQYKIIVHKLAQPRLMVVKYRTTGRHTRIMTGAN